jgi:hypothetical protein
MEGGGVVGGGIVGRGKGFGCVFLREKRDDEERDKARQRTRS